MQFLGRLLLIGLIFFTAFIATTALLDWVCWHTGYYEQAAQMSTVMD